MTTGSLMTSQLNDSSVVEEAELLSDRTVSYSITYNVVSTTGSTKTIVLNASPAVTELTTDRISENDLIKIVGGAAAGTYIVNSVVDATSLTVKESIPDSSGVGTASFYYRAGAEIVGFDNATNGFLASKLQGAVEEIDFRQATREPTGFLDRTQCTMSFTNSTKTFRITPVSTEFIYYIRGRKYSKTIAETVPITDMEGIWYIYYDGATLTASQTQWLFNAAYAFVAYVYWDATNKLAIIFADERHGLVMDWATHQHMHKVEGSQVEYGTFLAGNYILGGDGSLNTHAQLSIGNGNLHDEDLIMNVVNAVSPVNPFEQKLSTIAYIPIYYKSGVSGEWRKLTAQAWPVANQVGNTCRYNKITAGSWGLTNAASGYVIASWIFATNNIYEPIICVLGQKESNTLSQASSDDFYTGLDLTGFPFLEAKLLYRAFFYTNTAYTNTPKASLASIDGLLIPNIVPSPVVNYNIVSSTPFVTTSLTDVMITNFTTTPQAGTYAVWYNASVLYNTTPKSHWWSIYKAGLKVANSERIQDTAHSNQIMVDSTMTVITVDGTQTVDVRVRCSTSNPTAGQLTVNGRTLLLVRLGA